ncbi:hypothetical protein [Emticicia agri]|uniref:Uncharacterized protein n=1 Tax=Emticicia agri TaxID=2492393 RepID=A0A4V1ZCZ1_9BACT|nr:hypothetical protein [Emticicia agri]RYU94340.1 hypothetical protein EWM59_17600 [Emticicia agri]
MYELFEFLKGHITLLGYEKYTKVYSLEEYFKGENSYLPCSKDGFYLIGIIDLEEELKNLQTKDDLQYKYLNPHTQTIRIKIKKKR